MCLLVLFLLSLSFCGRQEKTEKTYIPSLLQEYNFKALDCVELYDYKSITVANDYLDVTDSDIITAIEMDMEYYDCMKKVDILAPDDSYYVYLQIVNLTDDSSSDVYYLVGSEDYGEEFENKLRAADIDEPFVAEINGKKSIIRNMGYYQPAEIEDEELILDFYGLNSMNDVFEYIRNRTRTNIIFYYMMDIIQEKSNILILPPLVGEKYDKYTSNFWDDIIIYKAILEKENKELTETELKKAIEDAAEDNQLTIDVIFQDYADSVVHFVLEQKVKEVLIDYITIE